MFVSRVAVSLGIRGLEKKSLVKITSFVHNSRVIKVYTIDKLVRVLRDDFVGENFASTTKQGR